MKTILYTLLFIAISYKATAQITLIPDPKFEQFLINEGIDSDGVINGQILTSDALSVTNLYITSVDLEDENLIQDVTGLEAFINLDSLSINQTMMGSETSENTVNLSTLVNLKYFETSSSMLTFIDFSHNKSLETIRLYNGGDVIPMNYIDKIDLSNNPNIHTLLVYNATEINLNNNNNNENMYLDVSCYYCDDPEDKINVCIEIDNIEAALNNDYPYYKWTIHKSFANVFFTDNLEECVLNKPNFSQSNIKIYPNPVNDILHFSANTSIEKITISNMIGQQISANLNSDNTILDMSNLPVGNYFVKVTIEGVSNTIKIIKN